MKNIKDTYIKINITSTLKKKAMKVAREKGLTLPDFVRYQITKGIEDDEREEHLGMLVREAVADYDAGKLESTDTLEKTEDYLRNLSKKARSEE